MKHITESPTDWPYRLVNFGVDTLVLNVRYADESGKPADEVLPEHVIACLNAWQVLAKEQEEPIVTPLVFDGASLQMYPHGAGKGQWRWLLTCPAFNLLVSRGRLNGVIAQVRFSAPFLWSHEWPETHEQDIWTPIVAVEDFLIECFGPGSGRLHLQVSQVHLCADIAGWDVSTCAWDTSFLSRARTRVDRAEQPDVVGGAPVAVYAGRRLATLEFGSHGSPLSCSIYNKSLEVKKSGKLWFQDIWRLHGWDGEAEVWRVEFRWKREALHEIQQDDVFHGVEKVEELGVPGRLSFLWTYCAGHLQGGQDSLPDGWLRYAVPSDDGNRARWSVHPAWSVVQSAFTSETETAVNVNTGEVVELPVSPLAVLVRQRHYEVNVKRLAQQVGGCATTLAAWLAGSVDSLPEVLAYLVDHLPAYALPDLAKVAPLELLKAEYATQFAEKVAERRAIYGLSAAGKREVQQ